MSRRPVFTAAEHASSLDALAETAGYDLDAEARGRLAAFAELVATWTLRVDLVAARSTQDLVEVVALDALVLAQGPAFAPDGARLIDVGAGSGAPTLPLLLLRPDLTATLLEPRRKRVAFLRTAVGALDLVSRVEVKEGRLEADHAGSHGAFDVALSRATFDPAQWLELAVGLAPRVLALTARGDAPVHARWAAAGERRYATPSSGAPRRVTAYDALE